MFRTLGQVKSAPQKLNLHLYARYRLELSWNENGLGRTLSVDFVRDIAQQLYGVERVNVVYETRKYINENDQGMITEFVSFRVPS